MASCISIVEYDDRTPGRLLEQFYRLTANPILGHMPCRTHLATADGSRKTTPDGTVPGEMGRDFSNRRTHGRRCRRGWREQAKTLSEQLSAERVDWRALNTCSTNINA